MEIALGATTHALYFYTGTWVLNIHTLGWCLVLPSPGDFQYKHQAIHISAGVKRERDMLVNKLLFFLALC